MNLLRGPKLSAQRTPPPKAIADDHRVLFLRDIFFSSQKKLIEISLIETVDVMEAINRRRKKSVDQSIPPGSCIKMCGKTSNTKVGPA